ncbi:hypothetical protein B484DRAFT_57239 [Ochromonadaceae sp. CCMP2298]|nr:hypothetical protein B484DRAFT_57239 [Ochromonadaceae sp. CCMP2298]
MLVQMQRHKQMQRQMQRQRQQQQQRRKEGIDSTLPGLMLVQMQRHKQMQRQMQRQRQQQQQRRKQQRKQRAGEEWGAGSWEEEEEEEEGEGEGGLLSVAQPLVDFLEEVMEGSREGSRKCEGSGGSDGSGSGGGSEGSRESGNAGRSRDSGGSSSGGSRGSGSSGGSRDMGVGRRVETQEQTTHDDDNCNGVFVDVDGVIDASDPASETSQLRDTIRDLRRRLEKYEPSSPNPILKED